MRVNGLLSSPIGLCRVILFGLLFLNVGCCATNGWVQNRTGMRQYKRGHYVQARHHFARAIAQDPCNPDYRHNLAMSIQKQGDTGACERILRHNLTIDAMHQPSYHSLAQLMVAQGRAPEAQDLIGTWAATQPYLPESSIEMAYIQKETGDVAGAEQSLQNALRVKPAHPIALAHLGELYHTTGRPELAASYYQRSLAANWDQPEVQSRLSTLTDPSPTTRSAMMQNPVGSPMMASNSMMGDPMFASNQMMTGAPGVSGPQMYSASSMVATSDPFGSDPQVAALEDVSANPAPRRRRRNHGKDKEPVMTSFPLPNFDGTTTAWVPSGSVPGQPNMAFQSPTIVTDSNVMPQVAGDMSGPLLAPQADPAHFYDASPEMTASIPVVDPH